MPIAEKPIKLNDPSGYVNYDAGEDGFFFLYPRCVTNIHSCREEFEYEWNEDHRRCLRIGFCWEKTIWIGRLARVWNHFEEKMGLDEKTIFYRVVSSDEPDKIDKSVVLLRLSPFWIKSKTHRSVCSLLLRLLVVHYTDEGNMTQESWRNAKNSYEYTVACGEALDYFLSGFTKPTYSRWNQEYETWEQNYNNGTLTQEELKNQPLDLSDEYGYGFVGEFANLSKKDIEKKLVKP